MSKRTAIPHYGDRKKPKLDISRSDHHLPLSQNISTKDNKCDVWGDDDDEQMLLQASQACEEEQINDISMLPDYSIWKQPGSTSTQYQPSPSTSKASFEFKKPSSLLPSSVSTHLKNKCNTISSPLPGISTMSHRHSNLTDDLAISDKIVSGQESDIYRRMLLLEEENNKLKSERGSLFDKIVTKEGEASILRSQLKASQLANDNARMEKIRAQEKVQMECNEKLAAITHEVQSLKSHLEFKDLEILSIKDKFKKLEANKLRLTQVNEISSHRNNNILTTPYDTMTQKKAKMTSNSVQTEDKAPFLKLNKSCGKGRFMAGPHHTLSQSISNTGRKVTFNRTKNDMQHKLETQENAQLQLLSGVRLELHKLEAELVAGAAFEDNARPDLPLLTVPFVRLLDARPLYKDERGVELRKQTASLAASLDATGAAQRFFSEEAVAGKQHGPTILDTALRICNLIEKTSSSALYSGFLMSIILTFDSLLCAADVLKPKIFSMTKAILLSKPMPFVVLELLAFVKRISLMNNFLPSFCPANASGNDGMEVDQGNINPEPCYFAVLLKQVEDMLSCIKAQRCGHSALLAMRNLIDIFDYVNDKYKGDNTRRCECQLLVPQVLVRCLRESVEIVDQDRDNTNNKWHEPLLAACRSCVRLVHTCVLADAEWPRLHPPSAAHPPHAGLLGAALHRLHRLHRREPALPELTELINTFQTAPEDTPSSYLQQPFMHSFEIFSMND